MPGVTLVAAASERMHLRLAGYRCRLLQERRKFADDWKWIKSTYSTKTTWGGTLRNMPTTRELLNVRDTARILGVHENTIRNWEERGILRALHLPGSGYRRFAAQDVERLRTEMFAQLAPATEGPVVNPGRKRTGRLVFGDATE
jgi:hypothetical protein